VFYHAEKADALEARSAAAQEAEDGDAAANSYDSGW